MLESLASNESLSYNDQQKQRVSSLVASVFSFPPEDVEMSPSTLWIKVFRVHQIWSLISAKYSRVS